MVTRQFIRLPVTARPVPSRREDLSRCTKPSRPVYKTYPYRPVPSKPAHTVPSRRHNLSLPSNPAVKLVPTVPPHDSLPSLLPVKMP